MAAFEDLSHRDALAVLAKAPTPAVGARLSVSQIRAALRAGGRQRNLERRAGEIHDALRTPHLQAPEAVANAFAATTRAAIAVIRELNRQITQLETSLHDRFEQHPDADRTPTSTSP